MALENGSGAGSKSENGGKWGKRISTGLGVAVFIGLANWVFGMIEEKTGLEVPGIGID